MNGKKSFIMYNRYFDVIEELSVEEAGQLLKMIYYFQNDMELPEADRIVKLVFKQIKGNFERDNEEYERVSRKNSENVKKRWAKKSAQAEDTKNTTVCEGIRNDTYNDDENENKNENNNDTDNVSVNVNVNDSFPPARDGQETDNDDNNKSEKREASADTQGEVRIYGENVRLTEMQYGQLCREYGESAVMDCVSRVDCYLKKSGKKPYPNHFTTMSEWLKKDAVSSAEREMSRPYVPAYSGYSKPSVDVEALIRHAIEHRPRID